MNGIAKTADVARWWWCVCVGGGVRNMSDARRGKRIDTRTTPCGACTRGDHDKVTSLGTLGGGEGLDCANTRSRSVGYVIIIHMGNIFIFQPVFF